nr:multidrug resistance-associated protein 1 [Quercus suber]
MLRGSLICLIFDTTLGISEGEADKLASVTLMSTDIDRIMTGFTSLDSLWAGPIEASIAIYLLERELGVACVVPVVISLACTIGAFSIMKWASNSQKEWVGIVQKRVATTAAVIMSIKIVKMQGLADRFSKILHALRVEELANAKPFRRNIICTAGLSNIGTLCAPVLTFMVYVLVSRETSNFTLNVAQAFTSLSLISLLSTPVSELVQTIPTFAAAMGCLDRVETYIRAGNGHIQRRLPICDPILHEDIRHSATISRPPSGGYALDKKSGNSLPVAHTNDRGHLIMTLDDVSIRYTEQGRDILKNITAQITCGSLTVIAGPVGCGKSTLAKALLGELPCSTGSIRSNISEIAYCASESWLPNQSLREVVLGAATYEQGWYEVIVEACALRSDIATLSKGDETIIGSKGAALSGGQKQRLALARAIYARKQLIILDSALSSLDIDTDESIYRAVLGPEGLCKRHGFTVVCFTHTGKFAEARSLKPWYDVIKGMTDRSKVRYMRWAYHVISIGSNGTFEEQHHQQDHIVPALESYDALSPSVARSDVKADPSNAETICTVENEEEDPIDLARRSGDISLYAYLVRVVGWPYSMLFFFTVVLYALAAELQIVLVQYWSAADSSDSEIDTNMYFGLYGMLAGLGVAGLVGMLAHMLLFAGPKLSIELHRILAQATMGAPLHWFVSTDSGITLNRYVTHFVSSARTLTHHVKPRFSQDMSLVDMDLLVGLIDTAAGLAMATVEAVLIVLGAKYAVIALPFIFVAVYVLQSIYLRTSRQLRHLDLETKAPLYSHFLETCSGLTTIRAFGWQAQMAAKNRDLLDTSQRPFYLLYCVQRWLGIVLDLIVAGAAVLLMTLATQVRSTTSGGALGVALVNVLNFNITLGFLIEKWTALETSLGAVARVKNFEKEMSSQTGPPNHAVNLPIGWPSAGELVIDNISAVYKPASSRVLHNVSIHVPGGQRVGLTGRTGSGKSSLILSILRQISLETGSVVVDGVNLDTLSDSVVCHALISIPQELCLLPGTIRSNADPFGSVPDAVITAALDAVGLGEVVRDNGGLDADMASVKISRGQQQLFGVARALCRKEALGNRGRGILLLDETTSDVDAATEQKILTVLADSFHGWTTLNVAHRLEALKGYDRIIVLEEGRVFRALTPLPADADEPDDAVVSQAKLHSAAEHLRDSGSTRLRVSARGSQRKPVPMVDRGCVNSRRVRSMRHDGDCRRASKGAAQRLQGPTARAGHRRRLRWMDAAISTAMVDA